MTQFINTHKTMKMKCSTFLYATLCTIYNSIPINHSTPTKHRATSLENTSVHAKQRLQNLSTVSEDLLQLCAAVCNAVTDHSRLDFMCCRRLHLINTCQSQYKQAFSYCRQVTNVCSFCACGDWATAT